MFWRRLIRDALAGGLAAAALALIAWLFMPSERLEGMALVVDGDSLRINGSEIRLQGIDAPEWQQMCERAGRPWACGQDAAEALSRLIANRPVACVSHERDKYHRHLAQCSVAGADLGAQMVRSGHAVAYGGYESDEREARDARRGLWAARFERPSDWRKLHLPPR